MSVPIAEVIAEYKRIHAAVWPEVLQAIADSNIRNYTIFLKEPENLLFAYWEYHGTDFAADLAKMADVPKMRDWFAKQAQFAQCLSALLQHLEAPTKDYTPCCKHCKTGELYVIDTLLPQRGSPTKLSYG